MEGIFCALKAVVRESERVRADGQIHKIVTAIRIRLLAACEFGLVADDGHDRFRQNAAGLVGDGACDAAESLLRLRIRRKRKRHPKT